MSNPSTAPAWFSSFYGFTYDPYIDLRTKFNRLSTARNWGRKRNIPTALGARNVLVNLIVRHLLGVAVIHFANRNAFMDYTLDGRLFPLRAAKEDGFIKALLRKVY
ncbi:hypothetical protein CC86DRAFT_472448 [Ophiobolus disseminans]|uniref:Uncharacterized protein n=1 Tax=Ophiobolus disseminans TaxID=1469910 RepID=A0A6A6ZDU9_9PLEO|nr:hypothetical protein CC86DRAFT_472448 [Ophiobolus disseminans]